MFRIDQCSFGDTLGDLHDSSLARLAKQNGLEIVDHVEIEADGTALINKAVEDLTGQTYSYLNKHLVLIGEDFHTIKAAYSYDGRRFGLVNLKY